MKNICVFCSSSNALANIYNKEAEKLADLFLDESFSLVYGGAKVGLMGILAKNVMAGKGHVTGVIPELIHSKNLAYKPLSELIITEDMKSRKAKMAEIADGFIALPGGFGTIEELIEVITLKQLDYHNKPIVIVNTAGFYDKLFEMFEVIYENHFANNDYKALYFIAKDSEEAIEYLKSYKPGKMVNKWDIAI